MTDRPAADAAKRLAAFVALAPTHDFYVALQQVFGPNAPSRLREDIETVLADLWAARDLAFRAAFASAEGEHYEWGVATAGLQHEPLVGQQGLTEEAARRYAVVSNHPHVVQRLIGPWKFAPSVPQEKP